MIQGVCLDSEESVSFTNRANGSDDQQQRNHGAGNPGMMMVHSSEISQQGIEFVAAAQSARIEEPKLSARNYSMLPSLSMTTSRAVHNRVEDYYWSGTYACGIQRPFPIRLRLPKRPHISQIKLLPWLHLTHAFILQLGRAQADDRQGTLVLLRIPSFGCKLSSPTVAGGRS